MQEEDFSTLYLKDAVSECTDLDELRENIIPVLKSQQEQWAQKIVELLAETGYTRVRLAELCGVSRVSVEKWCRGSIPRRRETFLRIGLAADYDEAGMNRLLQRYGRYPALYSKSLEDCVCSFVIGHGQGDGADKLRQYDLILSQIRQNIIRSDSGEQTGAETAVLDEKLSAVGDERELEAFVRENSAVFATAYHRFYAYVKMCIEANFLEGSYSAANVYDLALGQEWSSSLRQCVSAIRQKKWYPTRNKIISLGLHLGMDHEQFDQMLELAHMEPLCAKNPFESVIIFILEDAGRIEMLDRKSEFFSPDDLRLYAKEVMEELDMPEVEAFLSELSEIDEDR